MKFFNKKLSDSFRLKNVFKVIVGLNNQDVSSVVKLTKASELAHATYIDIVANTKMIYLLKSCTNLPICVSSIDPLELYNCSLVGADIVEIGNFDTFYSRNILLSKVDIFNLALETRSLIPDKDICVTIPYYLNLFEQITLAKKLEEIGINIIQTEACPQNLNDDNVSLTCDNDRIYSAARLSSASLSSTYAISRMVNIPVLTASGINSISSPLAFIYGASGVGIGSSVKNHKTIYGMYTCIKEVMYSMANRSNNSIYKMHIINTHNYDVNRVINILK